MATVPSISVGSDDFQSVNTLSSITTGTNILIQNLGTSYLRVVESDTKPDINDGRGLILTPIQDSYATVEIGKNSKEIWAISISGTAILAIQEL